jgi:hypothetical protein
MTNILNNACEPIHRNSTSPPQTKQREIQAERLSDSSLQLTTLRVSAPCVVAATGINDGTSVFAPAVTMDGSVQFMKLDGARGKFRLCRAHRVGAGFESTPSLFQPWRVHRCRPCSSTRRVFYYLWIESPSSSNQHRPLYRFKEKNSWGSPSIWEASSTAQVLMRKRGSRRITELCSFQVTGVEQTSFPQSKNERQPTFRPCRNE